MGFQQDQPADDFINYRRLEIHIQQVAQRWGYDGSPYADLRPDTMTLEKQFAGHAIYLELPVDLRRLPGCKEMCHRVVGSSSDPDDEQPSSEVHDPRRSPSNRPSIEHPGEQPQKRQGRNYGRRHER